MTGDRRAVDDPCSEQPRLRIGVITYCTGAYGSLGDAELSAAALPLIERGAGVHGRRASTGIEMAEVAGRLVELVRGCAEALEFSTLTRSSCATSRGVIRTCCSSPPRQGPAR